MRDVDSPVKIPIPFAATAAAPYINPVPTASQISIKDGAASFTDGYPPLTFVAESSGGAGPFGGDTNGLLYQTTAGVRWLQAGGPIYYDSVQSAAMGGYPNGAIIQSSITPGKFWQSTVDNNTGNPDGAAPNWSPIFMPALPLSVPDGGTGAGVFDAGSFILGNGSSAFTDTPIPLNVSHGGTGAATLPLGSLLVGNGTSPVTTMGVLPVNTGGTGDTAYAVGSLLVGNGTAPLGIVAPGTAGYNLVATGAGAAPVFKAPLLLILSDVTVGTFSFVVPADTWFLTAEVIGSGGGGAMQNGSHTGGGGGAGGYAYATFACVPGQTVSYTIAAGGAGGTLGGDGANGGSVSMSATSPLISISATGGFGGTSVANAAGGQGGQGHTTGQLAGSTDYGGYGTDGSLTSPDRFGGNGGGGFFGGGSRATAVSYTSGEAPVGSGGGSGYDPGGTPPSGQPGIVGRVRIWG